MAHTEDPYRVLRKYKQYPVVTDTQSQCPDQIALESGHVSGTSPGEAKQTLEDPHGCLTIDCANIGLGFIEPLDRVRGHYWL